MSYAELEQGYLEQLDVLVQASVAGEAVSGDDPGLLQVARAARDCWQAAPYSLRRRLQDAWDTPSPQPAHVDLCAARLVQVAANVMDGDLDHDDAHEPNEMEDSGEVLRWMSQVHRALRQSYTPPGHRVAMARASSVAQLRGHFPGYQQVLTLD